MTDRGILYAAAFMRALATGLMGVLLGIYLAKRGFTAAEIGIVIGAGLSGAAVATLIVTFLGDRLGRRRALLALGLLGAAGGILLIVSGNVVTASLVAFIGMVNGMGRDRGAALVLEQAILPATTNDAHRTRAFAWYNVLQDVGHGLGGGLAALPTALRAGLDFEDLVAFELAVGLYAALVFGGGLLYTFLTPAAEAPAGNKTVRLAPESRRILTRISLLFALDSLAGGFLGAALLSYFFYERFGAGEAVIAGLFVVARAANAASHLGAAWLAARIGLVNTMVYTHIPSSLLLMTVPFAPSFPVAAALFLLREALVEMDVPTRQSYVMAMVRAEERTLASGVTHLVRMAGWALAPFAAGFLMQGLALGAPLYIGGAMKIAYDLALYRAFRHLKPPEERARAPRPAS